VQRYMNGFLKYIPVTVHLYELKNFGHLMNFCG
jgi:hypothetical protein